MHWLYIHGFNSSSQSGKAQETKRYLAAQGRETDWLCPDLSHYPDEAIQQLTHIIEQLPEPPVLIGSSLGGFYATVLVSRFNLKAVLINPAVNPSQLLKPAINTLQKSWYGDSTYIFTQAHLDQLIALELSTPHYPDNILMMQEKGDEVLDWEKAVAYYSDCHQLIFNGGDHGFSRYRMVLSLIDHFFTNT
ncbi:YqiA/YcfP family alpha/beta fold hydrolase [Thiofilum flexile]|uniref:YqiA/YcfP family alpha/beta fold hydrolase n=1 Tax=Thiofilum flexile TaxID=125627 RepID=UPI00036C12F6|nr:YqiA/YcfP family alpha/beta fold hydrolase [Thiofilum flexile]